MRERVRGGRSLTMTSSLRIANLVPFLLLAVGLPCFTARSINFAKSFGDVCGFPLSEDIAEYQFTASTNDEGYGPYKARFASVDSTGWKAHFNNTSQWLQVELPRKIYMTGVLTLGNTKADYYVTNYKVEYSLDGERWQCLLDMHGHSKIYTGNVDNTTPKLNKFRPAVLARYVRIVPLKWHKAISMKLEIFGGGCAECWEK